MHDKRACGVSVDIVAKEYKYVGVDFIEQVRGVFIVETRPERNGARYESVDCVWDGGKFVGAFGKHPGNEDKPSDR